MYFIDNTAEQWVKNDNAKIKAVDNSNGHDGYWMTQMDEITWSVQVPKSAYNITFDRYNPDKTTQWNSWSAGGRDGNNAYYADGNEYGHWGYLAEDEMHFHEGDVIYLDISEFPEWENDDALMYVNFTNASKNDNYGQDIEISIADHTKYNPKVLYTKATPYKYVYTASKEDEGSKELRFWRGNSTTLWNCSIVLSYEEYSKGVNCVKVSGWNNTGEVNKYQKEFDLDKDTDDDGTPDYIEEYFGTDKAKEDTDGDGLSDFIELYSLVLDPLNKDTDNDGISDAEEDIDEDGLTNVYEISMGTSIVIADTDEDGLSDAEENYVYGTNPLEEDTDGDGASDYKEIEYGTNPLVYEDSFEITKNATDQDTVEVSVDIELSGEQLESLTVEKYENEFLFPTSMAGYIGGAYNFKVDGSFDKATINFEFDKKLLDNTEFEPIIYYFNENTQLLEELETTVSGNIASTEVTHFSKYILLNRKVFQDSFEWQDVWSTTGFSGVEVVLVIDDSGSMSSNDSSNMRLSVAQNLIDKLPKNSKVGIVRFTGSTYKLTSVVTDEIELAKSYLTTSYFKSSGGTNMYNAIDSAFSMYESTDDTIMKMMVVLSDGATFDTGKHSTMVTTANNNNIKIYTVGLGNSNSDYFTSYLKPLANNTSGAFYLASDASKLEDIYEDINKKIDIETDSDNDGIADYYEENMVMFNAVTIKLDKNNPDSDGDGVLDGEEVYQLNYKYNDDKTKVIVTGRLLSNPLEEDSDGDLDSDAVDPEPFDYQLNDLLCYNISQLNNLAIDYKNKNNYGSSEFNTKVETWLTFMFVRQFNSSYVGGNWNGTGKSIDDGFVEYVKKENAELYKYFENKSDFYATSDGKTGDLYHLAATATGYIYNSNYEDGFKFGLIPEYHLNNLSGWAGDLQTAMNNASKITNNSNDYDIFKETMRNLIGYDASVSDIYSEYEHSFDIDDVFADTDAYNLYILLKSGETVEEALNNYYKTGYLKRYCEFTNYWSESKIKDTTYIYTKNKYMGLIQWPLFEYDFKKEQSEAARDAFAEFLIERIKYE